MGQIKANIRKAVYEKYFGCCAYCGCALTPKSMHIDHKTPKSEGGTDDIENLNPACRECNNYKGFWDIEAFREAINCLFDEKNGYLFRSKTKMRVAERFGAVMLLKWDGKFFFEKFDKIVFC